ncbi:MAG TPA: hypothetical protein VIZ30_07620 [Pseudomonadales bacterium]
MSSRLQRSTAAPARLFCMQRRTLIFVALVLTGCSGANVQVAGDIPTPLVNRLPLRIGLYLEPALVQYVFEEKIEDHGDWRVEVGPMQSKLFRQVSSAMFVESIPVESLTPAEGDLDAVLAPTIAEFQISIPAQTRSEFYEVWIKYLMHLYDRQGTLIAEWPLTAYGKANRGDFGFMESSDKLAIHQATMTALRDAGAFLALRFSSVPEVRSWLDARAAATPGGAT